MKTLMNFPYRRVLVLGLAKSGAAAARLLKDSGVSVRLNDLKAAPEDPLVRSLRGEGVEVVTGDHPLSVLDDIELLIKNPGIPYSNPIVEEAANRNIPVWTEVELAGRLASGSIIGITGSNGKTTTTTLIYEMLIQSRCKAKIAGNIGEVASEVARSLEEDESMVTELSSFQLMGIDTFRPQVSVFLNIFEAHLDYHGSLEAYALAKANIFANQQESDFLVYNADDARVTELVKPAKAKKVPFSLTARQVAGSWCDETFLYFREEKIIALEDIRLVGNHNRENILAAVAAAKLSGATTEGIIQVLTTFSGVKHRLQFVKSVKDRLIYNDSKATNILATSKALAAFRQPVILLAGGLDRGNAFDELIPSLEKVKALVVFGETAEKLKEMAEKAGIGQVVQVENIEEAVREAFRLSRPEDVILLSPACASWDQYRTFEERGDRFIEAVRYLS